jgi:hypothetical protein
MPDLAKTPAMRENTALMRREPPAMDSHREDSPSLLTLTFWMVLLAVGAAATVPVLHSKFSFRHLNLRGLARLEALVGPGLSAWLVWLPVPLLIGIWVLWNRTRLSSTSRRREQERPTAQ